MTNTIKTATAAVLGARHARIARNGQDAVAVWTSRDAPEPGDETALSRVAQERASAGAASGGTDRNTGDAGQRAAGQRAAGQGAAVIVVCDGCSSGAGSEVGARLGASLFARAVGRRIEAGASVLDGATWNAARGEVVAAIAQLLERMHGDRLDAIREHFLFTVVAAAMTPDEAAVWAVGDGVYSFGDTTRQLGPFTDNEPPYLAYDLLGDARTAQFETTRSRTILIGTDGATEIAGGIERFAAPRFLTHPDALRRELTVLARASERIDWDERRIHRTPAALQDDCALAIVQREAL